MLVFVSVFFILALIMGFSFSGSISFSKAIAAERNYQAQMNFKETAIEAIRQGANEGFGLYNISHDINKCDPQSQGGHNHPECFRIEEARLWARSGAFLRLSMLDTTMFDPDSELEFFCASLLTDDMARAAASAKMQGNRFCPGCQPFSTTAENISGLVQSLLSNAPLSGNQPDYAKTPLPSCMALIYPVIEEDPLNPALPPGSKRNPGMNSIQVNGYILSIVHSKAFGVSSSAHIPPGYEVVP